ncbi:MAG: FAD-dependent oxidoreductase [Candidatus Altiarchaeota archaeon]
MHDLIIVGAGPAGITAAVYAARKTTKTLVLSKDVGGQAAQSWDIENYTGYQFITGPELAKKLEEHLKNPNIESKIGKAHEVVSIVKAGDGFKVKTTEAEHDGRTVIVASGRKPRRLNAPGESEFKNRGVTYCATCDGPLFAGKDVAIIGGGNSALDAAMQMIPLARRIYMIDMADHIIGDTVILEKVRAAPNVQIMSRTKVREIVGSRFVQGIKVSEVGGDARTIPVEGVFIEIGSMPANEPGCDVSFNERGEIKVNERCETNVPGLFAAGDVTNVPEKQIIVAAGQGCIASLSAFRYISRQNNKEVGHNDE